MLTSRSPSLPEVHGTVSTSQLAIWRRLFAFAGPAYLVSVGYMDPGNWATDLEGGARFGYRLLWVLVMSNAMAILLQTLSARLGIVNQRDLAQACREAYPRAIAYLLWFLCEVAIVACDLAEVLGAAIALNLLFHIPLFAGVLITAADTLLIMWFTRFGIRVVEAFVLALIAIIGGIFFIEILWAGPVWRELATGLAPSLNSQNLLIVVAIIGATVMPHNLYLHSALVQTRRIGTSLAERRTACRYNLIDSAIALNGALFVNASILILAASVFFKRSIIVTEIQQAHLLLAPLLGTTMAGILFAVALLCSGQSSTLTGTMAGQIVMEGFLNLRMRPWMRRLITRLLAITPAALTIYIAGDKGIYKLLLLSQVVLNMQLPFAIIPLIHFTSDRKRMGEFANRTWVRVLAWTTAAIVLGLDLYLVAGAVGDWSKWLIVPIGTGLAVLLAWITFEPLLPGWLRHVGRMPIVLPEITSVPAPFYRRILVPLDHTERDREAVAHAASMAKLHGSKLHLLHVEEGVTSQVFGSLSSTAEVEAGKRYLEKIVQSLEDQGIDVELVVRHSRNPTAEIVKYARELEPDLLVMGAHGHKGIKDIVLGTTINAVRHELEIPLLIVRTGKPE